VVKTNERKIETFTFHVEVCREDIEVGKCRDPHRCMERVAIARALTETLGENKFDRLRLDGAQIKFNYNGYRWYSTTPKKAKTSLIAFDAKKPVSPHKYSVTAIKGTRIKKVSAERQNQVNLARKARIAAGTPDKKPTGHTLHQRVIGLGAV
jgi:hypothetical protein